MTFTAITRPLVRLLACALLTLATLVLQPRQAMAQITDCP